MQADVNRCAIRAVDQGDHSLAGSVRLELLTRKSGQVYAAFAHSGKGSNDVKFDYCLAMAALLWQYPPTAIDTEGAFPISVAPGGDALNALGSSTATAGQQSSQAAPLVFLPSAHPEVVPADLDVARAQATLNVLGDASEAEKGIAALAVHDYQVALGHLRAALAADSSDPLALRGLAQVQVESHGDLDLASEAARKLLSIAPESVSGPEALLRVCAARGDDKCVFEAWQAVLAAKDLAPRSRLEQEQLKPLVDKAAARLRIASQERGAPQDPCAAETAADKQALCEVKRCLDAGSADYARELSTGGAEFEAGEWRFKDAGKDRLLVTRPIASKAGEHRDAIFLVKMGDKFSIQASSADARKIAAEHNSCAPKPAAAPAASAAPASAAPAAK